MKRLVLSFVFVLLGAVSVQATPNDIFYSCAPTLSVDSGNSGRVADASASTYCSCGDYINSGYCGYETFGGCAFWETNVGTSLSNLNCCVDFNQPIGNCFMGGNPDRDETIIGASKEESLETVFAPRSGPYWGVVNGSNRSDNYGRSVSAAARLDVCLGYGDVDTITALANNDYDRYQYCAGSTYGCATSSRNEYCQASGSAVCIDRCACMYSSNGVDTCNNL